MNRKPPGFLLSKAINGFLQFKTAEGLSPTTIDSYRRILKLWMERQPDVNITKVTAKDIRDYMNYMRLEYVPRRITGGNERKLSRKSIRNIYVAFKAFFRWAKDEFHIPSPMDHFPTPRYTSPEIIPFTKEEVEKLLKACDLCDEAQTDRRRKFTMRRATAHRDRAIILMLLDTGLRASELCSLHVEDVDLKSGKISVWHGVGGGAKGGKGWTVFLGKTARKALWRYLVDREDGDFPAAPLLTNKSERSLNKDALRQVINALGGKAGIKHCYPHRFRHTFAITYLRSGGDLFTLKSLLGHSSLDMVQHYARVAEVDVEQAHRKASPADNWRL
jgi:integrase/recombinase XerD